MSSALIILELIYALNTVISLFFFFVVLIYLLDSEDLRTPKNTMLLGFYIAITGFYFSYFLYINFLQVFVLDLLLYSAISILSIASLILVLIFLFSFIVMEANIPYRTTILRLAIGLYIFVGSVTIAEYLIDGTGGWIHNQVVFTKIGLSSIFILAELLIVFALCVSFFKNLRLSFFPEHNQSLINYPNLYYFVLGIFLGGISEVVKIFKQSLELQILGAALGTVGLTITILIIITTRKQIRNIAWKIIEFQLEELKELDLMKDQFIDTTSHEIRTPLTIIWGYIELLKKDLHARKLTITQYKIIFNAIERSYFRIESLLNRIYDLSRLRRGLFELNIQPVNLKELLENNVNDMKRYVEKKGLQLTFLDDIMDDVYTVNVDPNLLDQVVRNLIENAAKFSEQGEITVTLIYTKSDYVVSVRDEGIGIDSNKLDNVFDYFQSPETKEFSGKGLGLGLFISKSIIELHYGRIWVESEGQGKGSTFSFSIPRR
ncbi:MAG: sensor histidine kinase [Candidatus Thorarchaeota archaeon]